MKEKTTKFDRFSNRMPKEYRLLDCGTAEQAPLTIRHDTCGRDFVMKYRTVLSRLTNKRELCPECNKYLPGRMYNIPGYTFVSKVSDMVTLHHSVCDKTFSAKYGLIFSRKFTNKSEICVVCNPWDEAQIPIWERPEMVELYETIAVDDKCVAFKHRVCGEVFTIKRKTLSSRLTSYKSLICTHCNRNGMGASKGEFEVRDFVKSTYSGTISTHDRKVIHPYELDIYLPNLNLAIEYHGDYHHGNPSKFGPDDKIRYGGGYKLASEAWERDAKKKQMCADKNVRLLVIWESEWLTDRKFQERRILETINSYP